MKYVIDHDLHLHSQLSQCSSDPEQTTERMLQYAREHGLSRIAVTDHFWDENVPGASNWYDRYHKYNDIVKSLPLSTDPEIKFLFGCETDMDKIGTIGISPERYSAFDFIIVSTTHMHMKGFAIEDSDYCIPKRLAVLWVERFDALLNANLPFSKVGIAHLATACIAVENDLYYEVLDLIPESEMTRLFTKAAELGLGIEINASDFRHLDNRRETLLRPFRIAKACGCKFYLGTDAHNPSEFSVFDNFAKVIDFLDLEESDKFIPNKQ